MFLSDLLKLTKDTGQPGRTLEAAEAARLHAFVFLRSAKILWLPALMVK